MDAPRLGLKGSSSSNALTSDFGPLSAGDDQRIATESKTLQIRVESSPDVQIDEKGREVINRDVIARAQLRIDARKWYAARLAPKKYGDKLPVTHEAADTKKTVVHSVEVTFVAPADSRTCADR